MVIGRILGMAGKALAKKFLSKPVKTFKKVDKITPHFKKKLVGAGVAGNILGVVAGTKSKKKKD